MVNKDKWTNVGVKKNGDNRRWKTYRMLERKMSERHRENRNVD